MGECACIFNGVPGRDASWHGDGGCFALSSLHNAMAWVSRQHNAPGSCGFIELLSRAGASPAARSHPLVSIMQMRLKGWRERGTHKRQQMKRRQDIACFAERHLGSQFGLLLPVDGQHPVKLGPLQLVHGELRKLRHGGASASL
jgi:hypothetical protein